MSASDIAAWWGAVVASLVFVWDIYKWLQEGPDIKVSASPNMQAFGGLRHAEIDRLDWSEIDLEDGFIEVTVFKSKTEERRLVPIHENLKKWLQPYRQTSGKVVPYANTSKQLAKIARKAGIKWKHNALRHSFISYRVAECADIPRVADEAGNSPQMIRQHYLRRVKPALAAQWFNLVPEIAVNVIDLPACSRAAA